MEKNLFYALFVPGVLFIYLICTVLRGKPAQTWRWLKGSRKSYYLSTTPGYEEVYTTHPRLKLRTESQRMLFYKRKMGSIIEISYGFLRRRSAIYGRAEGWWQVARTQSLPNGVDQVFFDDRTGLPVETALRLINTYPSLQAMLDRIAELDKSHKADEARFQAVYAAVVALRFQIFSDKQRYRGVVAQELREDLDMIIEKTNTLLTDHDSLKVWSERFQEHRREVGQSRDGGIK